MPRAFTTADVVQQKTGTPAAVSPAGIVLDNPTAEGNTGIIAMMVSSSIAPPEQWHFAAGSGVSAGFSQAGIMLRADIPGGEQNWNFPSFSGSPTDWIWLAEEWRNISYAPLLDFVGNLGVANPTSVTLTGGLSWDAADYAVGVAMVGLHSTAAGVNLWPTVSWSGSFATTDTLSRGDGSASGDMRLIVARRYGTAGETGPWSTTATLTGGWSGETGRTVYSAMMVLRAERYVGEA